MDLVEFANARLSKSRSFCHFHVTLFRKRILQNHFEFSKTLWISCQDGYERCRLTFWDHILKGLGRFQKFCAGKRSQSESFMSHFSARQISKMSSNFKKRFEYGVRMHVNAATWLSGTKIPTLWCNFEKPCVRISAYFVHCDTLWERWSQNAFGHSLAIWNSSAAWYRSVIDKISQKESKYERIPSPARLRDVFGCFSSRSDCTAHQPSSIIKRSGMLIPKSTISEILARGPPVLGFRSLSGS